MSFGYKPAENFCMTLGSGCSDTERTCASLPTAVRQALFSVATNIPKIFLINESKRYIRAK